MTTSEFARAAGLLLDGQGVACMADPGFAGSMLWFSDRVGGWVVVDLHRERVEVEDDLAVVTLSPESDYGLAVRRCLEECGAPPETVWLVGLGCLPELLVHYGASLKVVAHTCDDKSRADSLIGKAATIFGFQVRGLRELLRLR